MDTKLLVAGALLGAIVNSNSEAANFWANMFKVSPMPAEEEIKKDPVKEAVEHITERIRRTQMRMIAWELELVNLVQSDYELRLNLSRRDNIGYTAWRSNKIPDTVIYIENMIRACDSEVFCLRDVLQMITEDNGKKYLEKLLEVKKVRTEDGSEIEETYTMDDIINKMYGEVISRARSYRNNVYVSAIDKLNGKPIGGPNMVIELYGDEQYRKLYELSPLKPTAR